MGKIFEDLFMDIQIRMISTCLEGLEDVKATVDYVFVYAFESAMQSFFNVFFVRENRILFYNDFNVTDDIVRQVLNYGIEDVEELTTLCLKHNRKAPNQYKLIYNLVADKLDTSYEYDDLTKSKKSPADVFLQWRDSIASGLNKENK